MTKCRRADDKLYNLIQFNKVPNLKTSDFKEIVNYNNDINLCFTNEKRKLINYYKMRVLNAKNHWKGGIKLKELPYDKRTQDVILHKVVPIMSKVNSEEIDLVNNQRFVITKVGAIQITIQDDSGMERNIFTHEFQKYFLVAYATTIHSSQGMSIGKNYTIHEWDRLDQKLKYVALSSARDHELSHIMK